MLQVSWTYLENIFNSPDIQQQLEKEHKKFTVIDQDWKQRMKKFHDNPCFFPTITSATAMSKHSKDNLLINFTQHNKTMEEIQRALENFLEGK